VVGPTLTRQSRPGAEHTARSALPGSRPGDRIVDLCCGKGEMLCTWSRDHGITGHGVDISTDFLAAARARAAEISA